MNDGIVIEEIQQSNPPILIYMQLFPVEYDFPEGFSYTANFISADEETFLLNNISKLELHSFIFQ